MLPNNNISITLVKNEMQTSNTSVVQLCEHENINIHSAKKPTYNTNIPSGFVVEPYINSMVTLKYKRLQSGDAHRLGDFKGYNHYATAAKFTNIQCTPKYFQTVSEDINIAFWYNVGEIDMRQYGFTHIRFTLALNDALITSQKLEIMLTDALLNSTINNSGGADTPYKPFMYRTYISVGGKAKFSVIVSYYNSDGVLMQLSQPGNTNSIDDYVYRGQPAISYPTNPVYTYSGDLNTYLYYMVTPPKLTILSTGNPEADVNITLNGKDPTVLSKLRYRNIVFNSPNGNTIAQYNYASETPDQAASKVLTYSRTFFKGNYPELNNPNPYNITVI